MNALKALENLPVTREQAESLANQIIEQVKSGAADPVKLRAFLKIVQYTFEKIEEGILDDVLIAAKNYDKSFVELGVKMEVTFAGAKYKYDKTNDPIIKDLHDQQDLLVAKIKEREKFLKSIPDEGQTIIDEETGETVKIYKPYLSGGKETIKCSVLREDSK